MNITKNFTLKELCKTTTGLANEPGPAIINNLCELCVNVLQAVRDLSDMPITVTSGYRCAEVNKAAGGAPASQHTKGEAADITCKDNARLFYIILQSSEFDQLIWEYGNDKQPRWIHVSYTAGRNRREVLKAVKEKGKTIYKKL